MTPADVRAEQAITAAQVLGIEPPHSPADAPHPTPPTWRQVPWRTIIATVGVVLGTIALVAIVLATLRIIAWVLVAGFFATVLAPAVRRLERRLGGRRGVAATIVVVTTFAAVAGLVALFIVPIRTQLVAIVADLPGTVQDAASGRGPIGRIIDRLGLVGYVQDHESELQDAAENLTRSPFRMALTALNWIITVVTVTLITILMLTQSSALGRTLLDLVPLRRRDPVRRATIEAGQAVSGYMIGNLFISLIAGIAAFVVLAALGVPHALVLALLVAFTDLLPLVGATIGAAVCALAAFLHDTQVGIVTVVFFVLYQQLENYVIYPEVMARTVKVNPLIVLLSLLVGAQLFGIVGAVLAVPASGAVQVALRAVRRELNRDGNHGGLVLPGSLDEET